MTDNKPVTVTRKSLETDISVTIEKAGAVTKSDVSVETGVPFLDHMLNAFLYYGGFMAEIRAKGDVEIDDHHTVEDVGIVLGTAFRELAEKTGPIARFGSSLLPMDDALSEAAVDFGGRAYLVYNAEYPQAYSGRFDMSLVREFLIALSSNARATIHANCRYGENSHHMAESLFKALGRAVGMAYRSSGEVLSTKGILD